MNKFRNAGYVLLLTGMILSLTNSLSIATISYVAAACCFLTNLLNKGK